jgi:hypothetical protein
VGEALDPLRLDPPLAWGRILTVLRFPSLARLVADRCWKWGWCRPGARWRRRCFPTPPSAGPGRVGVLPTEGTSPSPSASWRTSVWLDRLFGTDEPEGEGGDLGMLMVASAAVDRRLVFPPDVDPGSDLGRRMGALLSNWELAARGERPERFRMAVDVARRAANAGIGPAGLLPRA